MPFNVLDIARALACMFFAILFLQSGIDKISDRKGNLDWLTGHFASSPLKKTVPVLLGVLTIAEITTGAVALVGIYFAFIGDKVLPAIAFSLVVATFVMLFFGQRLAKDYPGAATIATYFGVGLLSLYLSSLP